MKIADMHYDFKQKLNKIDSQAYRNLKIPEIDWKLNEGLLLYILLIAVPRVRKELGYETFQRSIDDLRTLVKENVPCSALPGIEESTYILPEDYLTYLSCNIEGNNGKCSRDMDITIIKHGDRSQLRSFYESSFEWGQCNIRFYNEGIKVFHKGFSIASFGLDYIRKHAYIHNAKDFLNGTYTLPGGRVLSGSVNCELPEHTHPEIVDLSVLLTTGDLELPLAYQLKQSKLNLKQLN